MKFNEIKELMELFSKNNLSFIELTHGDSHICMKKGEDYVQQVAFAPAIASVTPEVSSPLIIDEVKSVMSTTTYTQVKSPMVGVFYTAPNPEEKPFISVGDVVKKGDVIGLIEAMKMMNEIKATTSGIVKSIKVVNEALVAFDDVLVEIEE